jgi:hypothetical protein
MPASSSAIDVNDPEAAETRSSPREVWPLVALGAVIVLMVLASTLPPLFHWHLHEGYFAPLAGVWDPRFGPGTVPAVLVGVMAVLSGPRLAASLRWSRLLVLGYVAGAAWMTSLATVDGWAGIGGQFERSSEYLPEARRITSVSSMLHEYIARIPLHSPDNWPIHVAGHPPGALLFFIALVRLGLSSGLEAGWVVLLIAATAPIAVLITLRRLGAEPAARRVAPVLVFGPAALLMAVSADAMFEAVAAWGLCLLAVAATCRSTRGMVVASVLAGLLLGYCVMLSYGLPLLGILAVAVLLAARRWQPVIGAAAAALAVVLVFAAAGFAWWRAYPVLRTRYYAGAASLRPTAYWIWGDLAALCFSAGPLLGVSIAAAVRRAAGLRTRDRASTSTAGVGTAERPIVVLTLAAALCIALADASLMSKGEVERIWLPFVPWLLLGAALLPARWRQRALAGQVAFAIVVGSLIDTHW